MRNAVLAAAIGEHRKLHTAAVAAFADHPSFPTARKAKLGLIDPRYSSGSAAVTPISYQGIIEIARRVGPISSFGPICLHGSTKRSRRSRRENLMAGKGLKSARREVDVARLLAGDRPAPFPNTRWHRTRSCQPEASSS